MNSITTDLIGKINEFVISELPYTCRAFYKACKTSLVGVELEARILKGDRFAMQLMVESGMISEMFIKRRLLNFKKYLPMIHIIAEFDPDLMQKVLLETRDYLPNVVAMSKRGFLCNHFEFSTSFAEEKFQVFYKYDDDLLREVVQHDDCETLARLLKFSHLNCYEIGLEACSGKMARLLIETGHLRLETAVNELLDCYDEDFYNYLKEIDSEYLDVSRFLSHTMEFHKDNLPFIKRLMREVKTSKVETIAKMVKIADYEMMCLMCEQNYDLEQSKVNEMLMVNPIAFKVANAYGYGFSWKRIALTMHSHRDLFCEQAMDWIFENSPKSPCELVHPGRNCLEHSFSADKVFLLKATPVPFLQAKDSHSYMSCFTRLSKSDRNVRTLLQYFYPEHRVEARRMIFQEACKRGYCNEAVRLIDEDIISHFDVHAMLFPGNHSIDLRDFILPCLKKMLELELISKKELADGFAKAAFNSETTTWICKVCRDYREVILRKNPRLIVWFD